MLPQPLSSSSTNEKKENIKISKKTEEHAVRVTVSEAARLFGVNPRTIRRAIARGELRYIVVRGRYKIHFSSLLAWSQRTIMIEHKRDERGIGQWVEQWKMRNPKFSPREPNG